MLRALQDDPVLLSVMGINPFRVRWFVFALGSAFAAGLQALDVGMDPHVGLSALLLAAVAVIIGRVGVFEAAARPNSCRSCWTRCRRSTGVGACPSPA